MCLAQGHNAVPPVRLDPVALRSQAKHSTTKSLRSLTDFYCRLNSSGDLYQSVHWALNFKNYRTLKHSCVAHQDNVGYLVEVNVQYSIQVN